MCARGVRFSIRAHTHTLKRHQEKIAEGWSHSVPVAWQGLRGCVWLWGGSQALAYTWVKIYMKESQPGNLRCPARPVTPNHKCSVTVQLYPN